MKQWIGPGVLRQADGPSFLRLDWIYLETLHEGNETGGRSSEMIGILSSGATSNKGYEDALIQAEFSSRFFKQFLLVIPRAPRDAVNHLLKMLRVCSARVHLLIQDGNRFEKHGGGVELEYDRSGTRRIDLEITLQSRKIRE
jgi:hypothetical protein